MAFAKTVIIFLKNVVRDLISDIVQATCFVCTELCEIFFDTFIISWFVFVNYLKCARSNTRSKS